MLDIQAAALATYERLFIDDNSTYRADFDYHAIPWHENAWHDQSFIKLYTGSAGGGKSRLAAEELNDFMFSYPGAMGLMVRKTRESMNNSTVLFFARKIASRYPEIKHYPSYHRFEYPKGSILAYGGMKDEEQREQIRSIGQDGSLDIVWGEEANKLKFEDHQEFIPRLRGKAGPYTQLIYTTNPDAPAHWINTDLIIGGKAKVFKSSAHDNPFNPPEYIENLNMLQGVQRARMVDGLWLQSEGAIYDNFDLDLNVTKDADYNSEWDVSWGVDDGYAEGRGPGTESYHPRVILLCQQTPEGGINVFGEYYKTQEADYVRSIDTVLEYGYPKPSLAYIDSSAAMFKANLWNKGITTYGATHPVIEGIRNVRRMFRDGHDKVLLHIHPRCKTLIQELQSYEYDETGQVTQGDRRPAKLNDHGCLTASAFIDTDKGRELIGTLRVGDNILTRSGYHKITACGMTNPVASVYHVDFSDGRYLRGTDNHPVYVVGKGFVPLAKLQFGDIIYVSKSIRIQRLCQGEQLNVSKRLFTKELFSEDIPNRLIGLTRTITDQMVLMPKMAFDLFIGKYGKTITERFRAVLKSITWTRIQAITHWIIWSLSLILNTWNTTKKNPPNGKNAVALFSIKSDHSQKNGIEALKASSGIANIPGDKQRNGNRAATFANTVESLLKLELFKALSSAQITVNQLGDAQTVLISKSASVFIARSPIQPTITPNKNAARSHARPIYVTQVVKLDNPQAVYNLTVEGDHEYFANGILVHNCDCLRYRCWPLRYGGSHDE